MLILYMTCKTSFLLEIDQGSGRAFLNGEKVEMKHLHSATKTQLRLFLLSPKLSRTHPTQRNKAIAREEKFSLCQIPLLAFSHFSNPRVNCAVLLNEPIRDT